MNVDQSDHAPPPAPASAPPSPRSERAERPSERPPASSSPASSSPVSSFRVGEEIIYHGALGAEPGVVVAVEWLEANAPCYSLRLFTSDRAVSTSAQRLESVDAVRAAVAAQRAAAQRQPPVADAAAESARERAAMEAADAALAMQLQEEEDAAVAAAVPPIALEAVLREALASSGLPPELLSAPQTHVQFHVQAAGPMFVPQFGFAGPQQQTTFAQLAAALAAFGGGAIPHFGGGQEMTYEQLLALQERLGGNVTRGASEAQLAALPVETAAEGLAGETCSICLCAQEAGERVRRMPCGHTHHAACLETWLERSTKCPVCRHELQ